MYYIMSEDDSHILESQSNRPTRKELQDAANFFDCALYVIQGEHTGMSAAPKMPDGDVHHPLCECDDCISEKGGDT